MILIKVVMKIMAMIMIRIPVMTMITPSEKS